ncbi:MAG: adenylyltransferase, partial [Gammaproteobacteria bacterium]|nr:adenylyltransferase [Gammaproteobacteria bacterium]
MNHLIRPYGGKLKNLLLNDADAERLKVESEAFSSITLTQRQQCDLEMLLNGALSPLTGFMNEKEYCSVLDTTRLTDGTLWPMPYYLDIDEEQAANLEIGSRLGLRDTEGFMPAVLTIESIWRPDKDKEAELIYGTTDRQHPGVAYLYDNVKNVYVGGSVQGIQLPFHYEFETLRDTPRELREYFDKLGWRKVVAFHTS